MPTSQRNKALELARSIVRKILTAKEDLTVHRYRFSTVENQLEILKSQKGRLIWLSNRAEARSGIVGIKQIILSLGDPDFDIITYAEWKIEKRISEEIKTYLKKLLSSFFGNYGGLAEITASYFLCKWLVCPRNCSCANFRKEYRAIEGHKTAVKIYNDLSEKIHREQEELRASIRTCTLAANKRVVRTWRCTRCRNISPLWETQCTQCNRPL